MSVWHVEQNKRIKYHAHQIRRQEHDRKISPLRLLKVNIQRYKTPKDMKDKGCYLHVLIIPLGDFCPIYFMKFILSEIGFCTFSVI